MLNAEENSSYKPTGRSITILHHQFLR